MAYKLNLKHESLTYTAHFARPILELWGAGPTIMQGLYGAFSGFGVSLSNIQLSGNLTSAADTQVTVRIGQDGLHKFMFDKVETSFTNFSEAVFKTIPSVFQASTKWLRTALPNLKVSFHRFAYLSHSLVDAEVREVLRGVN